MSDIFQEVDEEVRRERLQKLWDRYQNYAITLAVLVVVGVAAYRGYDYLENKKASESGTAFEVALRLAEDGKHGEAEAAFAKIAAEGTSGYRSLALLRQAAELVDSDPKAALAAYQKMAADASVGEVLQDLAGARAGALLIDAGSFDQAKAALEPLAGEGRAFRHTARELLAFGAWKAGDAATAQRWTDMIMADGQTPNSTRTRVEMLNALIANANKG